MVEEKKNLTGIPPPVKHVHHPHACNHICLPSATLEVLFLLLSKANTCTCVPDPILSFLLKDSLNYLFLLLHHLISPCLLTHTYQ